jgi:hypothetical protein
VVVGMTLHLLLQASELLGRSGNLARIVGCESVKWPMPLPCWNSVTPAGRPSPSMVRP